MTVYLMEKLFCLAFFIRLVAFKHFDHDTL